MITTRTAVSAAALLLFLGVAPRGATAQTPDEFHWLVEINTVSAVMLHERQIVPAPLAAEIARAINRWRQIAAGRSPPTSPRSTRIRVGHHFASELVNFGRGRNLRPAEIPFAGAAPVCADGAHVRAEDERAADDGGRIPQVVERRQHGAGGAGARRTAAGGGEPDARRRTRPACSDREWLEARRIARRRRCVRRRSMTSALAVEPPSLRRPRHARTALSDGRDAPCQ